MNEVGEYIQSKIADVCKQSIKEADRIILEYMEKRNLTLADLQDNVVMQQELLDYVSETYGNNKSANRLKRIIFKNYSGKYIFL